MLIRSSVLRTATFEREEINALFSGWRRCLVNAPLYGRCTLPCCVQLPSTEEIDALFSGRRLNTIVFFLDDTFEELAYDITTSVLESVEQLAGIIKLQNYNTFTL